MVLFLFIITQVNARGYSQPTVSLSKTNAPLTSIFRDIEKQSDFHFFFNETLLEKASKVTIHVQNVTVQDALDACFKNQEFLTYAIVQKSIIVKKRDQPVVVETPAETSATNIHVLPLVRGVVKDERGPVAGATISIRGGKQMTTTNSSGEFTLEEVAENAVIIITSVSHEEQTIRLAGRGVLSVLLKEKVNSLDEQVVVAYSNTTQRRATGSFTVVKGEDVQNLPNRSVDKSLQGLVPGLLVTSGTGQPGGGLSNFVLRGIATGSDGVSGSTVRNPLIVIDGVPITQDHTQWSTAVSETPVINPMAQLNPSDIETITVLKDAAAIALYGSKASNGVILITTKKGKAGRTIFTIHHQTDIATRLKGNVNMLNRQEYLELLYETYKNTPRNPSPWTDELILADLKSKFPTKADGSFYPATNWIKEVYSKNAPTYSNNISVSGGNEKSTYYLNLEYTKQNGIAKATGYDRKSLRFNFENRSVKWLRLGINSTLSYNIQDYLALIGGDFPGLAYAMSPLNPVRLENDSLILNYTNPYQVTNPVAAREYNSKRNTSFRGLSKIYAEVNFLKCFKLSTNLGTDFLLTEAKERIDPRIYDNDTKTIGSGRVQQRDTRNANVITTNMLSFDKVLGGNHAINLLLGQEAQIMTDNYLEVTLVNLGLPTYDQVGNAGTRTAGGFASKQTLLSYFGQLNYSFQNKYFLSSSIRNDGSSRFGERSRHGTYWSVGLGWIVTGESFMKNALPWINYLKLRGSIGAAGNSFAIDRLTRYDVLLLQNYLGGTAPVPYSAGNPDIKWEQTFTWDAGIEAKFWKERITIIADLYKKSTSDLIYSINLAPVTGYASVSDNIGDMENKGIELLLSMDIVKSKNLRWNLTGTWSSNKNVLVKANVPLSGVTGNTLGNEEGRNFNSFYLVRWAGVDPATGRLWWVDSTGKNNSDYGAAKREFVGKPQPDGFGSVTNTISYKNISLSAQLYYQYGFQIYDNSSLANDGLSPYDNTTKDALNRWQKAGDIAKNPKRTLNNTDGTFRASTRRLFNGDYIRFQNLNLSYNLPKKVIDRLGVSMIRIYSQVYNLAIWTKFPGLDPSNANVQGTTALTYPNSKTYSFGVDINL